MSFKKKLKNLIENANGQVITQAEIEEVSKQEKHKVSNAERTLRILRNEYPQIKTIRSENYKAIIGYYWDKDQITENRLVDWKEYNNKIEEQTDLGLEVKKKARYF